MDKIRLTYYYYYLFITIAADQSVGHLTQLLSTSIYGAIRKSWFRNRRSTLEIHLKCVYYYFNNNSKLFQ